MEDVLKVFEESKGTLDSIEELKEDYIVISIHIGDDKVGSFRFYKNSSLFKRLDKAVLKFYEKKKKEEPDYQERIHKIVTSLEKLIEKNGLSLMYIKSNSNEPDEQLMEIVSQSFS